MGRFVCFWSVFHIVALDSLNVDQAGLKLREPPAAAFGELEYV